MFYSFAEIPIDKFIKKKVINMNKLVCSNIDHCIHYNVSIGTISILNHIATFGKSYLNEIQ